MLLVRSRMEFVNLRRDMVMGLRQRGAWPIDGGVALEGRSRRSRRARRLVYSGGVAAIGLVLVAGCGSSGSSSGASPSSSGNAAASGALVQMKNQTLVDKAGMTLYSPDQEASGKVVCTGPCTHFWTPLTISGGTPPTVNDVTLTTIKRPDGKTQLAYQNAPLYTFTLDKSPGDMNGNTGDNFSIGGKNVPFTWKAVTAGGTNNAPAPSSSSSSNGNPYGY